ncbi:MAG TPA: S66 peptidase family protein [Candidatus Saccharimonadales bacterium]|jgi:muramoyltetrapeptide carboxypeptidase LdcA involved in peptidoglycan recycling
MTLLKTGDEIRVIAPSFSKSRSKNQQHANRAKERLESLGYRVTFGDYLDSQFHLGTATAEDRARDFNKAFADKSVKAIMAFTGGWSANEILPLIDWELVKAYPKPIIGFSDITVLINAIYAKTGNVGYLGPNFLTLGRMTSWQYTLDNLQAVLRQDYPFQLKRSKEWGSKPTERFKTKPWQTLQMGEAKGVLVGGNLGTFYLLQGTEYQPNFEQPFILVAEDDDESGKLTAREFSRRLESILQLPNVRNSLRGLLIGRFQPGSKVTAKDLASIVESKQLGDIPVVVGIDFGHTSPTITLPIGGILRIEASNQTPRIEIVSI